MEHSAMDLKKVIEIRPTTRLDTNILEFAMHAIPTLNENVYPEKGRRLTSADKLSMLVAFCGIIPEDKSLLGKTLALGFEDEATQRLVYQTVPVIDFHYTPFMIIGTDSKKSGTVIYDVPPELQSEYGRTIEWPVSFGGNFLRQRNHHFTQSDRQGNLLPVTLLVNPKTDGCDEMCKGCSRVAMNAFSPIGCSYIEDSAKAVDDDFAAKFPHDPKSALKYLNIMTGCQPNSKEEYGMFLRTMQRYRELGYNPAFFFYTNIIEDEEQMRSLAKAGALGYGSTLETINDQIRLQNWGNRKGGKTFLEHMETLKKIKSIFTIAEVGMVFGQDDFHELSDGIARLDENQITIAGNVQRGYSLANFAGVHPSVWQKGLSYFTEIFEQVLELNGRYLSSARYIRERGLECLAEKLGRPVEDYELPYKYRG